MAAIAVQGTGLRHVRKTITFTGASGAGADGVAVPVFTHTGEYELVGMYVRVVTNLDGGTGSLGLGVTGSPNLWLEAYDQSGIAGQWAWGGAWTSVYGMSLVQDLNGTDGKLALDSDVFFTPTGDVTSGSLRVNAWYRPITDNGALAGDDIDTELVTAIRTEMDSNSTQLSAIKGYVDTEVAAIKAKTDQLTFTVANVLDANALRVGGTTQTGRDIGASVLISSGTGTGQLDVTSGVVKANLAQILGTALTETSGYIAAAFKQFFNVASPTGTMKAITNVVTATNLTNAPTAGDLTSTMKTSVTTAATAATPNLNSAYNAAKTAAQAGDAMALTSGERTTLAGVIWASLTSGLTTASSIGKLLVDNVNATISSRSSHAAADVWSVTTRLLSAGTNIVLAKGTGVTGFNDLSAAQVNAEAAQALADYDPPTKAELDSAVAPLALEATLGTPADGDLATDIANLPTAAQNADALLGRNIAGGSSTGRTVTQALRSLRNRVAIAGGTVTVYEEDDTTPDWSAAATTDAGANPITEVDPS